MKYRTKREEGIGPAIFFFVASMCGVSGAIMGISNGEYWPIGGVVCMALLGVFVLGYYCSCNVKRNFYRKKDKYIEGDFNTLGKKESPVNLRIPVGKYKLGKKKKQYV